MAIKPAHLNKTFNKEINKDKIYEVEIAGIHLRLKSSHDQDFVHKVVSEVNKKIQEALPVTKNDSIQTAALLACLNMSEELMLFKRQMLSELDKVETKAEHVLTRFESSYESRLGLDH